MFQKYCLTSNDSLLLPHERIRAAAWEIEGIDEALEYYDTTGYWKAEYDHFIDDCECGEDDPGPGITPIDRDMRDCALNCSDTNAFDCWEHFHITGEWLPGCKETMRDCGCYDPDDQHDCYRKALNYIKNELILEPYNNSCEVLEYVRTHFKCIPLPLDPEDPEIEDELPDDWDDGGGNDSDPGATDGPYDEYQRKPIWWYHSDHLGSSTYLTDNFGRPSHYYETLPFGEMIVEHNQSTYYKLPYPTTNTGTYDNKFKFNGKELDDATGMYYYGARYYDPRISIFVSVDPLAEQTMEPYLYAGNNPIRYTDPTGMAKDDIIIRGENNSSVTITTDLVDISVNAGSIVGDLGGNYTLQGDDILIAALDIVGIVDPTGVADIAAASLEAKNGNWGSALLSGIGVIPYVGDVAKVGKIPKHLKTIEKAIDATKNRVKLRENTVKQIKENAPKTNDGRYIDPNTLQPIDGPYDIGHKYGQEWRTRKKMHQEKGSTRKEVLDAENNPDLYQIEDRSSNRSHKYEKK